MSVYNIARFHCFLSPLLAKAVVCGVVIALLEDFSLLLADLLWAPLSPLTDILHSVFILLIEQTTSCPF